MLEKVIEKFNEYTKNYDKNIMQISLKYHHSFAVMDLMGELAFRLNLDKEKIELAKVIGLLHDIGRFEQFNKYKSFDDKISDHSTESVNYLFKENHIRDFIDTNKYDSIIEKAILYHNDFKMPDNLKDDELLFTKMIRDMDKVDIYKQAAVHYEKTFKADEVTEEVLKEFKEEKTINYKIMKSESDNIIKTLAFIYDINYDESFDILVSTDNFDLYLSMIEVSKDSEKLWKKLKELAFDKINRGIEK